MLVINETSTKASPYKATLSFLEVDLYTTYLENNKYNDASVTLCESATNNI